MHINLEQRLDNFGFFFLLFFCVIYIKEENLFVEI